VGGADRHRPAGQIDRETAVEAQRREPAAGALGVHAGLGHGAARAHHQSPVAVGAHRELLRGDLRLRDAQQFGVVERDVGERHGGVGLEDVGGIETAAEPGLDHGGLHARTAKRPECGGGEGLELGDGVAVRQGERLGRVAHGLDRLGEESLPHRYAVDLDAFAPVDDVR